MTKTSQTYCYKRLSVSKYHKPSFQQKEKDVLYGIQGMTLSASNVILITNSNTNLEELDQELLKKTVLLVHPNSGHDNISSQFIKKSHFPIIIGNTIRANAVSEYILSCVFKFFCSLPSSNIWEDGRLFDRKLLKDSKILIIGYGHIGKIVHASLSHLTTTVDVLDPHKAARNMIIHSHLDELNLGDYDVIIMACSLNETTKHMIDESLLSKLKKNVLIINAARGKLINECDLVSFLKMNPGSFAFLDVFENEPYRQPKDFWPKNCFKTSHIAGVYKNLDEEIINFEKSVINLFINNKKDFKNIVLNHSI